MRRFVKIAAAVCCAGNVGRNQAVAPIEIAVCRAVVARILNCPNAFFTVFKLLFGAEIVVKIAFETISGIKRRVGVFDNVFKVSGVDFRYLVALRIILTVSLVEINLGKQTGCRSLRRAAFVVLNFGKIVESLFQILGYQRPTFVVGILSVGKIVVAFVIQMLVHNEWDVLVEPFEKEMSITAKEFHLGNAGLLHRKTIVATFEKCQCRVNPRNAVVQTHPHIVDVPIGNEHALLDFQLMEHVAIACAVAALVGVVAAHVKIPHRKRRVDVFGGGENCVCRYCHCLGVFGCLHLNVA